MDIVKRTKPLRIAINMLCCALFFSWATPLPRETISGLFGRKNREANGPLRPFWRSGLRVIDFIHSHEPDHCRETAFAEYQARCKLGYHP